MPHANPLVTIGMPVYNGERTLAGALDSLLGQTCGDFELIVSDNASTDGTLDVVSRYAAADRRIQIVRQAENIGANPNYSELARRAGGRYFKWASSNDWCAPTFLERCVEILEQRADVVLVFPRTRLFAEVPDHAEEYQHDFGLEEDSPADRFVRLTTGLRLNNLMNGMIRVSALRRTQLIRSHYASDIVFTAHLALLGKFVLVPDYLFFRRMEPKSATRLKSADEVRQHHYPRRDARTLFQSWRLCADWLRITLTAPIAFSEKYRAVRHAARICYYRWPDLAKDFREAAYYLAGGIRGGRPSN